MVRVEIRNFQSIAHEVVEINGFSALVGRSNIGKSAVVRAIKAALTGAPADDYVRHGVACPCIVSGSKSCKCFCSVHIQSEGFDLLWEKGDGVNRYEHNGTEYTVVGRGTPEFLAADFSLVKIGDGKELLQVSDQFHPILLLDQSGTVVADVLSDVAKLDEINIASRLVEKDRKEASATRKVRDKDVLSTLAQLEHYADLDPVLTRVSEIEQLDQKVEVLSHNLERLDRFHSDLFGVAREVKGLSKVDTVLVPSVSSLDSTSKSLTSLERFQRVLEDRSKSVSSLVGVEKVPKLDLDPFTDAGRVYLSLIQWASKVGSLKAFFERVKGSLALEDPSMTSVLESRDKYLTLSVWASKLDSLSQAIDTLKRDVGAASTLEEDVLKAFTDLGVCPTCNQGFGGGGHVEHG